jgi:mono/diheme cytochrome c family protein
MRLLLAALVVVVMGCAIAGVGMGEAPAERQPAPSAAATAAARQRVAALGPQGRRLFAEEGCDRCHSIAAIGADGKLGPRLDTLDDDADDIAESIADPRADIADGFPEQLMPADYAERMSTADIRALSALVAAASSGEAEESDEDSGRGRGRNRGRGGED